ncbi:MAG: hypothetical protein IJF07_03030 [Lachnospiraceae bacterium]|nr:hypothetical protein [Lachnospiraceae bacterium]
MSYEINIIAINQKEPVKLNFASKIILQNEKDDYMVNRYAKIWPYFSNTSGVLYSLVMKMNEEYYSSFPICDSDFETEIQEYFLPTCLLEENKENLTPFIVREPFIQEFIEILQYLLENSPQKRILFQTRYQGGEQEIIVGVIKMKKFLEMLKSKKVLFNVCYIVESDC